LRIKVMQTLYSYFKKQDETIAASEKELFFSIEKSYQLYYYLLLLIIDIADYAESRIELAKRKKIPSYTDLHPNTRFIDNRIVKRIRNNGSFTAFFEKNKLSWVNYPELIKALYQKVVDSEGYREYSDNEENGFKEDKKFIIYIYKHIIAEHEDLYDILEEQSIFWNDEIEFIISIIIKTINKLKKDKNKIYTKLYKNEEDKDFVKNLFRKTILHHEEYEKLIREYSKNWDVERIAFMDILLMQMAITEAIEFKSIPTKVTFNEYLELSKFYSTAKSNVFINGILDKVFEHLKKTNQIVKQGRGLIGEV
jgi:transcription antitermination protein NusB